MAELSRRGFLKIGAAGTAVLATASVAATLAGCSGSEPATAQGFKFLREADVELFRALTPVVLAGALPAKPEDQAPLIAETLKRVDAGCYLAGTPNQKQLRQLFDLLNFRLTRAPATGVSAPWREADAADIAAFLERWRGSSVGLFNGGYRVLVKLVAASYYGQSAAWPLSGYPGPLALVYQAVNS